MKAFLPKTGIFTVVFLIANLFFISSSFGQDTGLLPPSTSLSVSSVTTVANGLTSNNAYAVFDSSGDQADYGGFNVSIPAGSIILGIEVQLEGNRPAGGGRDLNVQLTWNNKTTFSANKTMAVFATTDALRTVGTPTDTWGRTWAVNEFANTSFFVRITSTTGGGSINLDQVLVKVYYCTSPTIITTGAATAVCFSASLQTTTLPYTATTNSPTSYSIAWTGMANQGSTPFAFSAGGGTITGINIPASTAAGTYNGILTINAGGCSSTNPISVTVNALPTANAGSSLSPICQGGTSAALGGSVGGTATGGTWSDGGIGGAFSPGDTDLNATWTPPPGYSGTATLTLTSSGGLCGTKTASKTQVVNIQPTASAGVTQTICSNKTAIINGTATNGTIVWTVDGGATVGTLDNPNIESPVFTPDQYFEGTATLTMTVTNAGCTAVSVTSVVIVNGGAATVDQGADVTVCMSTPEQVPLSGIVGGGASSGTWSGGSGQFLPNNTDMASSYTPTQSEIDSGSVILTLTSEDPGGPCPGAVAKSRTITFKKAPTATAGGNIGICPGGSAMVNGASSSNGTIVWTHNGSGSLSNADTLTPTYTSVAGDAGNTVTLTLTVSNSPCPDAIATYTVVVNPLPINRSLLGTGTICSGFSTNIQVIDSEYEGNFGISYQLRNNANNALVGAPLAGTGSTIDLPTGALTSTTTFNVLATNLTTNCFVQMSGTITISVNPAPLDRTVGPATITPICSGSSTNITVATSTNATTTYQLRNDADDSPVGLPVTGTGGTINLPTGILTNITDDPIVITYNVLATITATGCTAQMAITKAVTVNPLISDNIISGNQSICSGSTPAALTGEPHGGNGTYTYGWFQSTDNFVVNNANASTANGSRTAQTYTPPSLTQTMWYRRTVSSDACAADTSPAVKITVNPLPTVFTVTGGGAYCAGGVGLPIDLSGSQIDVNYQLLLGGIADGDPIVGTGSAITFGNKTAAGTYTVVATATYDITTNCNSNMTGSVTITVNPVPETTGVTICPEGSGELISSCPNPTLSAGPKDPGTGASATGTGTVWANPTRVVLDDASYSTASTTALGGNILTNSLHATNFDFSAIPNSATILGIEVTINRFSSVDTPSDNVKDNIVSLLKAGVATGSNYAVTTTNWPIANTTVVSYGGALDLWGTTWTPAEIKAINFGVALTAFVSKSGFNTSTASVDNMKIKIYYLANGTLNWYTVASGPEPSIGSGSPFNPVGVLNSGLPDTNTAGTTTFYAECTSVPGCRTATDFVVYPLPTLSCPSDSAVCIDTPAYTLTATPAGGTYSGTGVTASTFDPATAGVGPHLITYSYTDGNGCSNTCTFTITVNATVVASGTKIDALCKGASNGSIDLSVTGGSGSYTYLWSNGETTEDISGLAASVIPYSVTITDINSVANSCVVTGTTSFTIGEPDEVIASGTPVNVLCNGTSTGSIDLTVTGGSGTYTYLWDDNGSTDADRTGLAASAIPYTVTITESNGCTVAGTIDGKIEFTITEPVNPLETNITASTNVDCFGNHTGSATVEATGGTPGYTYLWKDGDGNSIGQTTATASGLAAGNYTVTVTDADGLGCVSTEEVTIEEPIKVTVSASATNPVCSGSAPGTITISDVSAGATTIIQLNGVGDDLSAQTSFAPGTYIITASAPNWNNDGNCTATAEVTIAEPVEVTVDASSTDVSCHGEADGTITITNLSPGASAKIQLDGIGDDLSAQDTFGPGTYLITASAPNGNADGYCTVTDEVTITEPDELTASITAQENVDCFGNSNGSATVTPIGGTLDYTYEWKDGSNQSIGQTTATASNLVAGNYSVTVTDGHGCTTTATANIIVADTELPTVITKNIEVELNPTSVSIEASDVDNGSHDNCAIQSMSVSPNEFTCLNVGPNIVTLTVTDTNGNVNTGTATVTVKDLIKPVISGMPANKTVYISGSNCSALVKWIAPTATDNCGMLSLVSSEGNDPGDPVLLGVGVHTIVYTATDVNNNFDTASFTVTVIDQIVPTITNCPSNVTVNTENNICGARVFYVQPNVNDCNGASLSINNVAYLSGNIFPLGTTTVIWTATDTSPNHNQSSCSFTVTVEDHQAPVPNVASLPTVSGECSVSVTAPTALDNCFGTVTGEPDGVTTFNTPGEHTILWTYNDNNGNSSSQSQIVNVTATPPIINSQPVTLTKCEGQSATFSVSASGIGYQWEVNSGSGWENLVSETSSSLNITSVTNAMNGNLYRVIVNGSCGNTTSNEVALTVYSMPIVSDQADQNLCNTSSFTMTQTTPSVGTGKWTLVSGSGSITDENSPTTTITAVAVGTSAKVRWTVTNGSCSASDEVTVINTILPFVSNKPDQSLCNTSSFTMVQNTPSAGTGKWTVENGTAIITNENSPTTTITGVPVGTSATVRWTVTNVNCSNYDDVIVTNTQLLPVTDQPNQTLCNTSSFPISQNSPTIGSGSWSLIAGSANITSSNSPSTTVTGVAIGASATVRWTVTSGSCSSYDDIVVSNTAPPTVSNQQDQIQCNTSTFTMSQSGSGTWAFVGAFGSAMITTPSSPITTITGVAAGTSVTVRWTAGTGSCTASDDVILTNNTTAPTVSNQQDQTLCSTSTFTMTQSGLGTWTFVGSSGSAIITTPSSPTTTITGVAVGTNVTVRWTVGSGSCTAYDDVKLTNNGGGASFAASIATSSPDAFCSGLILTANPSVAGTYTYLWSPGGATTPSITLYNSASVGTYTVTMTKQGGCGETAQANYNFQPQNLINDYTILGFNQVDLGNGNYVQSGSVGVTKPLGYAKIGTNSTVAAPGAFVKARFITVQPMSNVPVRIFNPAVVVLPNMLVNNTSTTGLQDKSIPNNTTTTVTGNWKNVTIGTNCNVTFTTGTIFGKISIGKSSQVKFNANNTGVLNVVSINMADGTDALPTKLLFASNISVRVKETVNIGKSSLVNPTGGYKAVFFVSGNEFHVLPGGNVTVNASVFAPNGTIKVDGDAAKNTNMKGAYIANYVTSTNKNVFWNQFDCSNPSAKTGEIENIIAKEIEPTVDQVLFDVKAYPNPSNYQFTLEVEGGSVEKVEVEVYDMVGRHIKHIESDFNQPIVFGEELPAGTYLTIVNQGSNRKALKLIKK
ncbi:HYR domain-containing protein [Flavobacterium granuli]|uniref:Gliding motility-associated C-terminal domain-containing protein n=1 Tax=Flavobacterium granuli TaxID=280093 RepID=A0ABU1RYI7_9FLAO|nr:HYR domain-containing protein [Flavobacterium granuli]MDR6843819.1 hypothetical protein [Flavobacterium granuli]